jgi:ADP-ribosylglycohydrolase
MSSYARRSLNGIWVGDCIGNLGQLYFVHDILKAFEQGLFKFGPQLDKFHKQFQYSDDTEEAIVLYNHLKTNKLIVQDELAKELATRYYTRDPDGEIYGYGLNTRKVLKDIYDGVPWQTANKIIKKAEGMPSHIDSLVDSLSTGKGFKDAMVDVNKKLQEQKNAIQNKRLEGSCGNGSAMRVAVLGAYLAENQSPNPTYFSDEFNHNDKQLIVEAALQAEVTHCHKEGVAGSIAITKLANLITREQITRYSLTSDDYYKELLRITPPGQVRDGIEIASKLPLDLPVGKVIEVLGNGLHVTCQDTVPFCCYEVIKHLFVSDMKDRYNNAIIETSMAFGDVDTNCAIVGGCIAISADVPEKWINFCQPMEGVDEGIPEVELILPNIQENSL